MEDSDTRYVTLVAAIRIVHEHASAISPKTLAAVRRLYERETRERCPYSDVAIAREWMSRYRTRVPHPSAN